MKAYYYQLLGVDSTASEEDINKAFRKLAPGAHPDRFPEEEKENRERAFRELCEAREYFSKGAVPDQGSFEQDFQNLKMEFSDESLMAHLRASLEEKTEGAYPPECLDNVMEVYKNTIIKSKAFWANFGNGKLQHSITELDLYTKVQPTMNAAMVGVYSSWERSCAEEYRKQANFMSSHLSRVVEKTAEEFTQKLAWGDYGPKMLPVQKKPLSSGPVEEEPAPVI